VRDQVAAGLNPRGAFHCAGTLSTWYLAASYDFFIGRG
jgi:hypothetical protein